MSLENAFLVYKEYLISSAQMEGRPFSIPKSTKTFEERPDKLLFFKLWHELKERSMDNKSGVKQFFSYARNYLKEAQHISSLINNIDEIILHGREHCTTETRQELVYKIQKSISYIEEYCLLNKKSYDDLFLGTPPQIMKDWKAGKIDNLTGHFLVDVQKMKKEPWFKIFGKGFQSTMMRSKGLMIEHKLDDMIEAEFDAMKERLVK
jgi:hypothetical protein